MNFHLKYENHKKGKPLAAVPSRGQPNMSRNRNFLSSNVRLFDNPDRGEVHCLGKGFNWVCIDLISGSLQTATQTIILNQIVGINFTIAVETQHEPWLRFIAKNETNFKTLTLRLGHQFHCGNIQPPVEVYGK
jgi:hypothetical protein